MRLILRLQKAIRKEARLVSVPHVPGAEHYDTRREGDTRIFLHPYLPKSYVAHEEKAGQFHAHYKGEKISSHPTLAGAMDALGGKETEEYQAGWKNYWANKRAAAPAAVKGKAPVKKVVGNPAPKKVAAAAKAPVKLAARGSAKTTTTVKVIRKKPAPVAAQAGRKK